MRRLFRTERWFAPRSYWRSPRAGVSRPVRGTSDSSGASCASGRSGSSANAYAACRTLREAGVQPGFPPAVALHLIKLACELPDRVERSLSLWTCAELARTAVRDGVVEAISPQSVQRILTSCKLKPWRVHHWLSPTIQRDAAFAACVRNICDLYTRPLAAHERVLSLDEKTSIQPRCRLHPTRPAKPDGLPVRVEHEDKRAGALHLLASFDTRTGEVIGICRRRKRMSEFIELLEEIDRRTPESITAIHLVCDNVITHRGKLVRAWLAAHPRFLMHHTPVHCSWMNQVEQWFSILQRKRLGVVDFDSLADLESKVESFILEWNAVAHPFNWTPRSFDKVLASLHNEVSERLAA